ncbi:hypothetical protein COU59_02570 [Candidatus Pacearchaeota archaeon CG10_big_fil_rev_8_21_14_0_10_34_12]|nr:MAG: hypothetical protein COU59_02570 [Candidatus Pacearchaeota archaeon CG10_big_fil_rev_8_21_14_0_10_34_12]
MLTKNQIAEIRDHLSKAQNPIFFFDNDADGLCSFLLLQRYIGRGKGVSIKSFPELIEEYFRKVHELNADYIFILDKPLVSNAFFEKAREFNIPVVCIDHHDAGRAIPDFVNYYNPTITDKTADSPTTYLSYQVSQRKEDLWLAVCGCIYDKFFPDFYFEFKERFSELAIDSEDAFEIRYRSRIGKITNIMSFALKDRTTNVVRMMKFLTEAKSPYDVLNESPKNYTMHQRYNQINSRYEGLIEKAKSKASSRILFFQYGGILSISSNLADELNYIFPGKYVIVAFVSGEKVNISARGTGIRKIVMDVLKDFSDSTGGGHEDAIGAKIMRKDLNKFKWRLVEAIEKE